MFDLICFVYFFNAEARWHQGINTVDEESAVKVSSTFTENLHKLKSGEIRLKRTGTVY